MATTEIPNQIVDFFIKIVIVILLQKAKITLGKTAVLCGGATDSTVYRMATLRIEDDGWLRYQSVKQINGNNVINVDFTREAKAAA